MRPIHRGFVAAALIVALSMVGRNSQANVYRYSDPNPMVEIERSTAAGSMTGLLLGWAISSVDGYDESDWKITRTLWTTGTIIGFIVGLTRVTHGESDAVCEWRPGGPRWSLPMPVRDASGATRVPLVGARF